MPRTRLLSLSAAALVAALSLTSCGSDEPEPTSEPAASASPAAEQDPQAVADAANASYALLIEETLAAIEADLSDDAMDDFAAFVDEWYPQSSAWLAWDTFQSDVHAYAVLRTLVGVAMLSIGLVDDPAAEAEKLLAEDQVEASWVSFDGDVASVADPDSADGEDMLPINLVERDGAWLIDGTVFDDAWFEEQGTTPEEALNN